MAGYSRVYGACLNKDCKMFCQEFCGGESLSCEYCGCHRSGHAFVGLVDGNEVYHKMSAPVADVTQPVLKPSGSSTLSVSKEERKTIFGQTAIANLKACTSPVASKKQKASSTPLQEAQPKKGKLTPGALLIQCRHVLTIARFG